MMTYYQRLGELGMKFFQQFAQSLLLLWRACVGCIAVVVQPAFVADADRVLVMSYAVGTGFTERSTSFNRTVTADNIVVANALPVNTVRHAILVPVVNFISRTCLVRSHRTAMHN